MRLFFDDHITNSGSHTLSTEESKHIIRVLRLNTGDEIGILDGNGNKYICQIAEPNPKKCVVSIKEVIAFEKPKVQIHIAIAPTKQMERLEWFLEKSTEIGITEITLFTSENSERVKINEERLQKKLISAMKQSQRYHLPKLNTLVKFNDIISEHSNGLIAHCYEGEKSCISKEFNTLSGPILIGPEGDFTENEVKRALEAGYKAISLGDNRLRTETAALYACMQVKFMSEL